MFEGLQCTGASYPEIIGEGEVISLTLPDGSMKLYFQPTITWCAPFVQHPNDVRYNNIAWFVRNISSVNLANTVGNAVPQPVFNQSQSPYLRPPLPRPCFSCNSNIALPIQALPPCQLKFHSDGCTSTTDLEYFYPRVRKSDVVSKSCTGVQVSSPTATAETNKSCHCYVVCPKPCDCHKTCYQEMKADALSSSHGDTKNPNHFSEYHSTTREKDVDNSQSYMSIDEAKPNRKSSHKIKTKKITNGFECSSHLQKGIVIASKSVEDTKSKDIIDKKTKKEKVKKTKKKEQSQESLCRCCSSTAASISSLTSSEKKNLKLEKKEINKRKRKRDNKSSSQSKSKDNQSDTGTDIKTEEPNESDAANSSDIEEKRTHKKKLKKHKNEKKKKQDISIDDLVCLCSCCSTATRSNCQTSNEKKHRPKREKKVKKYKIKHVHEHTSAGSNKPERIIKDTQTTHVHECHSCLELEESAYCMCHKASNSSFVKQAVKEKVCDRVMQLDGETDTFSKQVATHMDQGTSYIDGFACGAQTTCEKPIIENPMLKCFPEINNTVKFPA